MGFQEVDMRTGRETISAEHFGILQSRFSLPAIVALVCLIPLLVTPVLPSIDFYAHIARYYVLDNVVGDMALASNYQEKWKLLPNFGMDILGSGIVKIVPPLLAAKILGGIIVIAPFVGALCLAYSLYGRITVFNVALSGILAYNFILGWGFANFLLGLGIALWGLGWWIAHPHQSRRQLAVTA